MTAPNTDADIANIGNPSAAISPSMPNESVDVTAPQADEVQTQQSALPTQLPVPQQPQQAQAQQSQAAAPRPQENHASLFQNILGVIAGGKRKPVMDQEGNPVIDEKTGQVKTQLMTTKNLGAGILAGALASMMAGFQHLPERNGNGVMQSHLNEASQAGAAAGAANTSQARVQQAQQVSDAQRMRQYQTMKQNLDLHSLAMSVAHQGEEATKEQIANFAPIYQAAQAQKLPDGTPFIAGEGSEADMQKAIKGGHGDVTRDSGIIVGMRPKIGPDGQSTGESEPIWAWFHNQGQLDVTPEMIEQYGLSGVKPGTSVPISTLVQRGLTQGQHQTAVSSVASAADAVNAFNKTSGKDAVKLDWNELVKKNPRLKQYESKMTGLSQFQEQPDKFIQAAYAISPDLGAALNSQLHVNADDYVDARDAKKKAAEADVEVDKEGRVTAARIKAETSPEAIQGELAKQHAAFPGQIALAAGKAAAEQTSKLAANEKSIHNEDGSWNMNSLPVALVEANADPSQLSKRTGDYKQNLEAANQYSMQKYGVPFDMAKATSDYAFAKSLEAQRMVKLIGSVTEPNGSLDIAYGMSNKLPQLDSKTANKVFNWVGGEFGSEAISDFHTAMIGLADEYSQIVGGGKGGTDTSRDLALSILQAGYSKGQFRGAVDTIKKDIAARKMGFVGNNRYLLKWAGQPWSPRTQNQDPNSSQAPPQQQGPAPEGTTAMVNGQQQVKRNGKWVPVQ